MNEYYERREVKTLAKKEEIKITALYERLSRDGPNHGSVDGGTQGMPRLALWPDC